MESVERTENPWSTPLSQWLQENSRNTEIVASLVLGPTFRCAWEGPGSLRALRAALELASSCLPVGQSCLPVGQSCLVLPSCGAVLPSCQAVRRSWYDCDFCPKESQLSVPRGTPASVEKDFRVLSPRVIAHSIVMATGATIQGTDSPLSHGGHLVFCTWYVSRREMFSLAVRKGVFS